MNTKRIFGSNTLLLVAPLLLSTGVEAGVLNDTGQVECFSDVQSVGFVSPNNPDPEPDGYPGQDCTNGAAAYDAVGMLNKIGASSVYGRDYTKISNLGLPLEEEALLGAGDNDWACTRDNNTSLIWEIKTTDGGPRDADWLYTWFSTDAAINGGVVGTQNLPEGECGNTIENCNTTEYRDWINSVGLCGWTDWRVPSSTELGGLSSGSIFSPSVDTIFFPNIAASRYWALESDAKFPSGAWFIEFQNGVISSTSKSAPYRIVLVRSR